MSDGKSAGRWGARGVLAAGCLLGAVASAQPKASEELSVVGFNHDGTKFAVVRTEPGAARGTLQVLDVASNHLDEGDIEEVELGADRKPLIPPRTLTRLGLGEDPGIENYKTGTRLGTEFVLKDAPIQVELQSNRASSGSSELETRVVLTRGDCFKHLQVPRAGVEVNLSSVISSAQGSALVIFVKQTEGGIRRYHLLTTDLEFRLSVVHASGDCLSERSRAEARYLLAKAQNPADPTCIARLRKLFGTYLLQGSSASIVRLAIMEKPTGGLGLVVSDTVRDGEYAGRTNVDQYDVATCGLAGAEFALSLRFSDAAPKEAVVLGVLGKGQLGLSAEGRIASYAGRYRIVSK